MPKNKVSDLITDQEMTFARLVLSGTMTDRDAAQAAGLSPDTAAYTKSKPRVRAYMLEHRAALQQQLLEQQAEELRRLSLGRERVLARLWEIASLGPEITRGSMTSQVKALSMIVAIQGLIPDRRAGASQIKSGPPPSPPNFYKAAWLRQQEGENIDPEPTSSLAQEEDEPGLTGPEPAPGSAADAPPPPSPIPNPIFDSSDSVFANRFSSPEAASSASQAPGFFAVPDTRVPFSIGRNPFARRR
jgi:hypothetical protein